MVTITLSQLREIVANGATKQEIADTYGLSIAAVKKLLNQANLKTKRQIKPTFELVDDTQNVENMVEETLNA